MPPLAGKLDAIPGQTNTVTIRADRPGRYRGQCAEFCGLQHARTAIEVVAEPRADSEAWRERQIRPAAEPATEEQARGRAVFLGTACLMCHAIRGAGAGGRTAPDLTHVAGRATLAAGALPNTRDHLAAWIADPQAVKPGSHMPAVPLDARDLQALVGYLESLR